MELNELAERLSAIENDRASEKQEQAEHAFMDKYGNRFNNNSDLGLVILNELNRRGVDTSAADDAVQQILDQLRMEATSLLDTIKENMNATAQLVDKIDSIDQGVQAAATASGVDTTAQPAAVPQGQSDMAAQPDATQVQPDTAQVQVQAAPQTTVSDVRMKNIAALKAHPRSKYMHKAVPATAVPATAVPATAVSDVRMKNIIPSYKPEAGIIAAASRGF